MMLWSAGHLKGEEGAKGTTVSKQDRGKWGSELAGKKNSLH